MELVFDMHELVRLHRAELEHPGDDTYVKAFHNYLLVQSRWNTATTHAVAPLARTMAEWSEHFDARLSQLEDYATKGFSNP